MATFEPTFLARRDLLLARAYYFAYLGGWGFILPFINLFYVDMGLNGKQIGTLSAASALVGLVLAPVLVSEVKKRPRPERYLQWALALGAIAYLLIGMQTSFWPILLIVFVQAMVMAGLVPVSDTMAVSVAGSSGVGYGSVRVWSSVGWIVSVLAAGWLIERLGFAAGFGGVAFGFLAACIVVFFIRPLHFSGEPANHEPGQPEQTEQPKSSLCTTLRRVWSDPILLAFAVALVFIGFLNNGVLQFENVYLSELGASKTLISVAGILSAVVELPFMLWADKIIRRVSAPRLMLLAFAIFIIQRLLVLLFPSIESIMIARFIGGTSFSFYTVAFIGLIASRTKPNETGTVLALYTITIAGLVSMLAAPVSGAIFDAVGARWLYMLSLAGYSIGLLSLGLALRKAHKDSGTHANKY
jgi:MFS transporter, PPP family, 3-phenylpropionic acid transporter